MALVLADRVRETTTTTGTGSVTLAGAYTGFQTFSAAIGNTNSTYYTIANVGSGEWEVGIGTYSSGGNLLSRTTVLSSSNGGSLVNFGAGAKDVFVTQPAERALYVASAGTGLESQVTAFTNGGIVYASSTSALATGSALVFDGTNLGLGVTPSAWSAVKGLQVLNAGFYGFSTNISGVTANAYYNSGWKYIASSATATQYEQSNGSHVWYQAPSGTAGNAITFTQAMTLDASGNLGIGITSLTQRFQVERSFDGSTWAKISNGNSTSGAAAGVLLSTDQGDAGALSQNSSNAAYGTEANAVRLRNLLNAPITFETNGSVRARIDSSGNLGIGTTSPTQKLTVAGNILTANASGTDRYINISTNGVQNTYLGFNNSGSTNGNGVLNNYSYVGNGNSYGLQILANGSVAATFDTSGNLLVNSATSYGGKIQGISTYIRSANGQSSQNVGFVASDFASNEWHFGRSSVDGYYYVVRQTGTGMYMNTNAWVATSDIRAKENIVPLESSLAKINSLNPVRFTFKKDGMADVGFIAQEMYEQIPEVVDKPEDEEAMMGISKEKIIPFLVKAIQEQQSIITTLTARITALEGA
jgi:hypothetical protein